MSIDMAFVLQTLGARVVELEMARVNNDKLTQEVKELKAKVAEQEKSDETS